MLCVTKKVRRLKYRIERGEGRGARGGERLVTPQSSHTHDHNELPDPRGARFPSL